MYIYFRFYRFATSLGITYYMEYWNLVLIYFKFRYKKIRLYR